MHMDDKKFNAGEKDADQTRVFRPDEIQDEIDKLERQKAEAIAAQITRNINKDKERKSGAAPATSAASVSIADRQVEEGGLADPALQREEEAYSALERKAQEETGRLFPPVDAAGPEGQVGQAGTLGPEAQAAGVGPARAESPEAQPLTKKEQKRQAKEAKKAAKAAAKAAKKGQAPASADGVAPEAAEAVPEEKSSIWADWILPILLAFVLAISLRTFVGGATTVKGESMNPTLENGDILLVSKIPTYKKEYQRADIVIIDAPDRQDGELYVKRIIGLPGETVRLANGKVFINDWVIEEHYIEDLPTMANVETEWTLGEKEYFVMGDNRIPGASNDSRYFGPVQADAIEGVATYRIFPFGTAQGL